MGLIVSSKELAEEMKDFEGLATINEIRAAIKPIIRAKIKAQKKADNLANKNRDLENALVSIYFSHIFYFFL
jgi:hypothetical protein